MNLVNFLNNHQSHLIRKPYIIAEVGVNHEGSINLAKRLIDEAAEGGAKAIKFQSYRTNTIASKDSPYYWDIKNEPTRSQHELFKKYNKFWKKEYEELKAKTIETFDKIDGLVNGHQNKSHLIFEPFEQVSEENRDKVVEVNLKETFLSQIISSYMAERGSGSIINFPSTFSVVAPYQNLYKGTKMGCPAAHSASKGGIDALSQYLSSYWAAKGVRVNMITPHGVWNNDEEAFEKNYANFSPMQRMSY